MLIVGEKISFGNAVERQYMTGIICKLEHTRTFYYSCVRKEIINLASVVKKTNFKENSVEFCTYLDFKNNLKNAKY